MRGDCDIEGVEDASAAGCRRPGVFIAFEGDDGVGKTTHAARLADSLRMRGYEVLCLREPGGTAIGEKLRGIVLDSAFSEMCPECELLIYEAARAQIVREVIAPALDRGAVVICDRFVMSTIAYQAKGRGLDEQFVSMANEFATGGLTPDLTIILYAASGEKDCRIKERGSEDRMELTGERFHAKVEAAFKKMAEEAEAASSGSCRYGKDVVAIEASGSIDSVAEKVLSATGKVIV